MSDIVQQMQKELQHPVMKYSGSGEVEAVLLETAVREIEHLRTELAAAKASGVAEGLEMAAAWHGAEEAQCRVLIRPLLDEGLDGFVYEAEADADNHKQYAAALRSLPAVQPETTPSYQFRVTAWLLECFGPEITLDPTERVHRFWEEALELGQATGCTASEAHQLVDYVFGRSIGELNQEIGGTIVCLAALCAVYGHDMDAEGERELARVWTKVDKIRAKHAAKPKFSPLPGAPPDPLATLPAPPVQPS